MKVEGKCVTSSQDKAEVMKQFFAFFTDKNASCPNLEPHHPQIRDLLFSANGIENVLNNLSLNKSPGPDDIPNFVLKLCSSMISPILPVVFTPSLNDHILLILTGCQLTLYQFIRRVAET